MKRPSLTKKGEARAFCENFGLDVNEKVKILENLAFL